MKLPSKSTVAGLLLLIITCVALSAAPVQAPNDKEQEILTTLIEQGHKQKVNDALARWIYTHSNKISITTCNEIAFEVVKSNKPLSSWPWWR